MFTHNVGFGDVVKYGLGKLGITQKPGCGCPKRQAWLNRMTPGYRPRGPGFDIIRTSSRGYRLLYSSTGKRSPMSVGWFYSIAGASDHLAATCGNSDVQSVISDSSVVDGDTVIIPSGTCLWTSGVSITKGITLKGQGADLTTNSITANDETVIQNGVGGGMLTVNTTLGRNWRITGFTIQGNTACGVTCMQMAASGRSHAFRIDHMKWILSQANVQGIELNDDLWGVLDHNRFVATAFVEILRVRHGAWQGVDCCANNSWAQPTNPGNGQAIFIEDNTFVQSGAQQNVIDGYEGARYVVRHNTFGSATNIENHGTDTSQELRSIRWIEVYRNTFTGTNVDHWYVNFRGGSGVVWENTVTGGDGVMASAQNNRDTGPYTPFGQCNGSNSYDQNLGGGGHGSGYQCIDQPGAGQGDMMTGNPPTNTILGGQTWPRQAAEPIYVSSNTLSGGMSACGIGGTQGGGPTVNVLVGTDMICDGTQKPGYNPYTYPHPLQSGEASVDSGRIYTMRSGKHWR